MSSTSTSMNRTKHNFRLKYNSGSKEWDIYDDGTLHTSGYQSRKEAQKMIDEVMNDEDGMSRKELAQFFTKWKNHIGNE